MNELIVIMPIFNEEIGIAPVLDSWYEHLSFLNIDFVIWAINDGSRDNTLSILSSLEAKHPRLRVMTHNNMGHGPTILSGYREAAGKAEWIFQVDSDGEMAPDHFDRLWNQRDQYDFLLGSRKDRQSPLSRRLVSFLSRLTVTTCFGKTVRDVNSPYRLMKSCVFLPLFKQIPSNTFAPNLIIAGSLSHLRFIEIPVPFKSLFLKGKKQSWNLLSASILSFVQTLRFRVQSSRSHCSYKAPCIDQEGTLRD